MCSFIPSPFYIVTSNPFVPLGFEGSYATIGPIIFLNSVNVVAVGVFHVDPLLVDNMLDFIVIVV